ncbi:DegT/DnrJ/EryC1/StrS family aminotransferase [bacterium]|nr:DegT/DnrJ/EryC1/StrS family aminotransferase [bacterium]
MANTNIYITKPLLPKIEDYKKELEDIWASMWLTNFGEKHNILENKLKDVLKVENLSLINNGTTALLIALKVLDLPIGSEVITTPFTFAATPHCITWNGCKPVFCDIEPETMTINADKIESLITPKTSAILGVHVYGFPCDVEKIDKIAKKRKLKVIYDAAHAFSTEINGKGIGNFGDITMFSFHATKLFNTIEGGCLTCKDKTLKEKINILRDFGIQSEEVIEDIGINGKMNEFQAAMGLENLKIFREEQQKRKELKEFYSQKLSDIKGIRIPKLSDNVSDSYQYYPIVIEDDFSVSRDELHEKLKSKNIYTRKYFYPACHDYECYKNEIYSDLKVVNDIKHRVLCLPFYGNLDIAAANEICEVIANV